MREGDDWGRDPTVRRARVLFGHLEQVQREVLGAAGVAPFDPRLRAWREDALSRFERAWAASGASDAATLYRDCLARVLAASGVAVPAPAAASREPRP